MGSSILKHCEVISQDIRSSISKRYHIVTKAINQEFWNIQSEIQNSMYVGSYGRGTAIDTSDLDILVELPQNCYNRFDLLKGNGQSRLLQSVRSAILVSYPRSDIRADGQVVKINFYDGMRFEILPAFKNYNWPGHWDGTYWYPDTNMGGKWCSTNPKAEQEAMKTKNDISNGLLYDTCKHIRRIRDTCFGSYHLSGIVIDSFVYNAIGGWKWVYEGEPANCQTGDYERALLDYFNQKIIFGSYFNLTAPGSFQSVETESSIECLRKVLEYMAK